MMNFEAAEFVSGADQYGGFFLYEKGLECIRIIQTLKNPLLTFCMKLVTGLVSGFVFFALIALLFWLVDERRAFRLGLLVLLSLWFNAALKALFRQPRPFHLDGSLGMMHENSGGFPSGHAQLIVAFLAPLAVWLCGQVSKTDNGKEKRGAFFRALIVPGTVLLILLVSFSRLYLGVHFPHDIPGGWFFAFIALVPFFFIERKVFGQDALPAWIQPFLRPRICLALSALISLVMNALHPSDTTPGALFLGFASGYVVMKLYVPFTARRGGFARSAVRAAAGFAGMLALYFGLKFVFSPFSNFGLGNIFRFIRYAILGFWVSAGAPWVFTGLESRFLPPRGQ